jgi:hypothetical protein
MPDKHFYWEAFRWPRVGTRPGNPGYEAHQPSTRVGGRPGSQAVNETIARDKPEIIGVASSPRDNDHTSWLVSDIYNAKQGETGSRTPVLGGRRVHSEHATEREAITTGRQRANDLGVDFFARKSPMLNTARPREWTDRDIAQGQN